MKKNKDKLFLLIKTMSRGEKRALKLFVNRYNKENHLYSKLFDILDRKDYYDEPFIRKKFIIPFKVERQYSVIKNQLFNLVLTSLRSQSGEQFISFKANSLYENAEILLNRGLYAPALTFLEKAGKLSEKAEDFPTTLKILSKKIEVYRRTLKASELREKTAKIHAERLSIKSFLDVEHDLERIYQEIFYLHRTEGVAETEELATKYKKIENACSEYREEKKLSTKAQHYLMLILIIFYYSTKNYEESSKHSIMHLALFENNPFFLDTNINEYLKALNNLTVIYIKLEKYEDARSLISKLELVKTRSSVMNRFVTQRIFEIKYSSELAICVEQRKPDKGLALIPEITKGLATYHSKGMSADRSIRLCFGVALLYFWKGNWNSCLEWNSKIDKDSDEAKQILGYVKILKIISHFELGNYSLVKSLVEATRRYLKKNNRLFKQESLFLKYMLKLCTNNLSVHPNVFEKLRQDWQHLIETDADNNLDAILSISSWLEKK